jgi:hypothetical protein
VDRPFQRKGAASNTQVGREFEGKAKEFFQTQGLRLLSDFSIEIGINKLKDHALDLGDEKREVLVECKAHKWTEGGNVPSAKMTAWNQAMYYFYLAPDGYRKIMFALKDFSPKRDETLAQYYLRTNPHLIPVDIEFWEFDELADTAERLS